MSARLGAGFLNLNKPLGITSHDAVARTRRRYRGLTGVKKAGHAGTLDPLADGVLVICLGGATRLSQYMMRTRKVYRATVKLGTTTTTDDAEGDILNETDPAGLSLADIEAALPAFVGEIQQIPPMYSAVKVGGRKLYELARAGQVIEREPRKARIHAIRARAWRQPLLDLEVECGSGVYIRSLARDLGEALAVGGSLAGLTRIASGIFHLRDSVSLECVEQGESWLERLVSPYDALERHPRLFVQADEIKRLRQGQFIARPAEATAEEVFAFDSERELVAILQPRGPEWKPRKVFQSRA